MSFETGENGCCNLQQFLTRFHDVESHGFLPLRFDRRKRTVTVNTRHPAFGMEAFAAD
ncbi:hypothetical protein ACVINW_001370 [Bradyrhizobium sp. USDA 4461]